MSPAPRTWTVTVGAHTVTVVAGTQEAAEKVAAHRLARGRRLSQPRRGGTLAPRS